MNSLSAITKKNRFFYLAPALFVILTIIVFNLFQNKRIYDATLGKIGFTYLRINNPDGSRMDIIRVTDAPFQKVTPEKLTHWDAIAYYELSQDIHREGSPDRYAFFPMFPFLWKIFHIPIDYIVYFNILLFLTGFFFFYKILKKNSGLENEHASISYLLTLAIPSMIAFSIPYSEATAFIMFSMALYFLLKDHWIPAFIFFILLAWCRPNTIMLLFSSLSALILFIFKLKKISRIKPIIFITSAGLLIGTLLLFTYYYSTSGNFWMFFEAQKHWGTQLQIPKFPFTDYASEVARTNIILLFAIGPIAVIKLFYMTFMEKTTMNTWLYIRFFAVCYFILTCLTVLFYQGGSLHSLHRYTLANPLGIIFIIDLCTGFIKKPTPLRWMIFIGFTIFCGLVIHYFDPKFIKGFILNRDYGVFKDIGTILFLGILTLLFWLPQNDSRWKKPYYVLVILVILVASIWDSILFNQFLSRGWLWA